MSLTILKIKRSQAVEEMRQGTELLSRVRQERRKWDQASAVHAKSRQHEDKWMEGQGWRGRRDPVMTRPVHKMQ